MTNLERTPGWCDIVRTGLDLGYDTHFDLTRACLPPLLFVPGGYCNKINKYLNNGTC